MKGILLIILLCSLLSRSTAQVQINELSICNTKQELDVDFDYSGWIELYNSSSADVNIKNLYFSDEPGNPLKYSLKSDRILPAGGFALVWLNGELANPTTGYSLDTDADDGGFLFVSGKNGTLYDSIYYNTQYPDVTYGRTVEGDKDAPWGFFLASSPGRSNAGIPTSSTWVSEPDISQQSGFYSDRLSVNISCATPNAKIYYTLDASEPTHKSRLYNGPIQIDTTTVLRACAFRDGSFCSPIATKTYLINERKPETLPVVFLNTDPANLYDDSLGIYCEGKNGITLVAGMPKANYFRSWTRVANFELQDYNNNVFEQQNIGLSISGNASRSYPQKSFKMKARSRYGKKRFDFPVFPKKPGLRHKTLLLRNGGQFHNSIQHIHDACIQSLADVIAPLDYQAAKPVVAFLNGKYWGLYNIREPKNEDMIYSHYGLKETDIDIVEFAWRVLPDNGSAKKWKEQEDSIRNINYAEEQSYDKVRKIIDLDNYLNYMSIQIHIQNNDWPENNQMMFQTHEIGDKWKWILQDLDNGLESNKNKNQLEAFRASTSTLMAIKLLPTILQSSRVADQYITTQSLVSGSVYSPNRFNSRITEMKDAIAAEYPHFSIRWPEQGLSKFDYTVNAVKQNNVALWNHSFDNLKKNFSLGNLHRLVIETADKGVDITFNDQKIPTLPYDGKWFEDKKLTLTAPLYNKTKKFAYWEIESGSSIKKNANTTLDFLISGDTRIVPVYETTRYARRDGLYINEISANNASNVDNTYKYEDWVEIYNSSDQPIDLANYYLSNTESNRKLFRFPSDNAETTTVPANGYAIVWCSKKTERGAMHTTFKLAKEGGSLYLSKEDKNGETQLIDQINYTEHDARSSFGRNADGGEMLVTFSTPTFCKANHYSIFNEYAYTEDYPLLDDIDASTSSDRPTISIADNTLSAAWTASFSFKLYDRSGIMMISNNNKTTGHSADIGSLTKGETYIIVLETSTERYAVKFIR